VDATANPLPAGSRPSPGGPRVIRIVYGVEFSLDLLDGAPAHQRELDNCQRPGCAVAMRHMRRIADRDGGCPRVL
jgi:hypothetical protein